MDSIQDKAFKVNYRGGGTCLFLRTGFLGAGFDMILKFRQALFLHTIPSSEKAM